MVTVCFDGLDTYGKTPDQLHAVVKLFCLVLTGQPIDKVRGAFRQWVMTNNKFPTPADIMNIISPPKEEWKPDWAIYTGLKKRVQNDGYYLLSDERAYLRKCEEYSYRRASDDEDQSALEHEARKLISQGAGYDSSN